MQLSGAVTCAALGILWGLTYLFLGMSSHLISPLQSTFMRVLFGFIPVCIFALCTGALRWSHLRHLPHFLMMALLGTSLYYFALATGTSLLPTSIAGVLNGSIPLFAFILGWLFLRDESMSGLKVLGVLLGFVGILLIAKPWTADQALNLEGIAYLLSASLCMAVSFVYAKRFVTPLALPAVALTTYQMALALLVLAFITPLQGIEAVFQETQAWVSLVLGLGMMCSGVAYITYIPPVVALVIGGMQGEPIDASVMGAILLILLGVGCVQVSSQVKKPRAAATSA
ncbi:DMT family transporter [Ectopseudomonas mendocina]|uniref:DMT family transporter n=1 Tax=Ectopseudomonas mendocina TaxID=300 RepID=A0ABZ2RP98_ECTME